ncbi:MAG: amino acid adenylation domain-containing protein [Candidatus Hydrogenedentota bacterium]
MSETLHGLLEASARKFPERIAVEDPDAGKEIRYDELDARSSDIARILSLASVKQGDRVGIYVPKSIGSLTAIFGALKAGAGYVPVDPDAPPQRNAFVFQDCNAAAIIVERSRIANLQEHYGGNELREIARLDQLDRYGLELTVLQPQGQRPGDVAPPDGLSYILYTSGSTGNPKGVIHTHASALAFVRWCAEAYPPTHEDKFSSHAPFHFDLSILDIYVPIMAGGTVVLLSESLGKTPRALAQVISISRVTVWYSTPSILRLLLEHGGIGDHDYSALRIVYFAGEVFPVKHLRALTQRWPHPRYVNLYGPTETNVCTYYEVELPVPEDRAEAYPIGRVCSDDVAKVMDDDGVEAKKGEPGELFVTGGSVMQGYWNLPERNERAFWIDSNGLKWHRTGDVVIESDDGVYLYHGRRDRMVKRRGYRVELGEIESALYRHESITEAAVIAAPDEQNGVSIRAFHNWNGETPPSLIGLKQFCSKNLPMYMIPDKFTALESLPKTSTDKIDYQRLKGMAQ